MPLSPLNPASTRYHVRRGGVTVSGGPFDGTTLGAMLADGRLDGTEEISVDRKTWKSVRTLDARAPRADPSHSLLDGGDDDGILLAPLDISFVAGGDGDGDGDGDGGSLRDLGDGDGDGGELSLLGQLGEVDKPAGIPGAAAEDAPPAWGEGGNDDGDGGIDLGAPLELVERKPTARGAAPPSETPGTTAHPAPGSASKPGHPVTRASGGGGSGSGSGPPGGAGASTVASLLAVEVESAPSDDGAQPLRLDIAPTPLGEAKARPRTLTAARGIGVGVPGSGDRARSRWRRPSNRTIVLVAALIASTAGALAALSFDLPDRLRGEPKEAEALGSIRRAIAEDRFPAFAEGSRLLEEAAGARRHASATRAAAAELLASSVVIHGGERGRVAHAEALLETKAAPADAAVVGRARASAWIALAKGRWREAEQIASGTALLNESDRAALRGWAAMGREDAGRAAQLFTAAASAEPPAAPSRVATRYALARAYEAGLSPLAEGSYRAVLAEAPAHFGAALGLARVSKLSAGVRLKLAEAVIAKQARDASRTELGEGYVLVARAARELGLLDRADAAGRRAREVDPLGVATAVLAGDTLLAEGRTDEAVVRYKLALAPPVSATRTPAVMFARVAALVDSLRTAEATSALAELERWLPTDARIAFWRGRAAERAKPPDAAAADRAYRDALSRDPRFLPASLQLARLLLDQHRGGEALAVLRRAEKDGAAAGVLRVALGQALLASGNAAEAARTFRQAIAADLKTTGGAAGAGAVAQLGLANALEAQGDWEGARAQLAALSARGDVPAPGSRVAALLVKLGRKEEALAVYQKEIAQKEIAAGAGAAAGTIKVAAARLASELGHADVARALAQAAVDEDPRTPGALLILAQVRRAAGDSGGALADLRRAVSVDGSPQVQMEYGRLLASLGRDEDALSALAQAPELPEAAVERGRILLRRGDFETAAKELTSATNRLPSHAEAFLLLGQAEDRLGHAPRAEAAWRTAVKLAPLSPESRYRLGRLEMDRGHPAAALPQLRAAAEHLPGTAGIGDNAWRADLFFQLGFAELRQGARDRALAAFRHYQQVAAPDAPARVEVTRQIQALAP